MSILDAYAKRYIRNVDNQDRVILAQYWRYDPRNPQDVRMYNRFLDKLEKDVEFATQYKDDPSKKEELIGLYKEYKRMLSLFGDGQNAPPFNILRSIMTITGNLEGLYGSDEEFIREYSRAASLAEVQIEKMESAVHGLNIELVKDLLPGFASAVNDFIEKSNIQETIGAKAVPEHGIHYHGTGMNVQVYDRDKTVSLKKRVQLLKNYLDAGFRDDTAELGYDSGEINRLLSGNEVADTGFGLAPQETVDVNYGDLGHRNIQNPEVQPIISPEDARAQTVRTFEDIGAEEGIV